ncbi:hypothetical protein BJX66DRAFT_341931 [Aspergillus keveii]|uniref:Ketoreductase domain-containing protein n=1 Tax=Aspergillus keveii TaxID=714993 RepID=A0ABR4FTZ9_9EURO
MSKVWFITGSSRGLGLAIAEVALESGACVIATARKPEHLDGLVQKYGLERVLPLALDVTSYEQVTRAVKSGHEKFGRIDYVVNNAGYANTASVEDMEIDDFRAQVDANLFGVVYITKAVLPILRAQNCGHIFQISSLGGRVGSPGLSAYQCSKWAPGGIRTDWAGSSMKVPPISEPYQPTVGAFMEYLRQANGTEPSLPSKIAQIILKLTIEPDPPLRLLIGPDAVGYAAKVAEALTASDAKWRELSISSA